MNAPFKQDARMGRLTTALGKDVLVLLRFDGADYVNGLFQYRVEALSTSPNLDFDGLLGTHASVEIESQNHGARAYDGIVTEAKWAGVGENGNKYALTLRPWFWLAGRRRNQRIFHNKTVVQIIEELLAPYAGLGDPALMVKLVGSYPELEYTVQYRESDFDFATRLMERFGISYHFAHSAGNHTLVLTDAMDQHDPVPGGKRDYKPVDGARQAGAEHFWEWHPERRLTTGAVRLTDYNFKKPNAAMEVERIGDASHAQGHIESYDYPGDYLDQGQGKDIVSLRTSQERGQDVRHRAIGDCTSLGSGMLLTLTGDQVRGVKGADYLCLVARHSYVSDSYGSGGAESDGHAYSGEYILMPKSAPLAPERKTRVPVVQGPQTAVVVGEGEIDCDEYGRILVHFHWDLNKAYSMRCRVSQNWASKGWGGMVIPRIGMEVVVEFLEGDPDKPLVTGCVYNGKNNAPYPLPEHKTRSVFRSDTHQGSGFNELRIEDEADLEEIHVHAQRDMNTVVRRDDYRSVGRHDGLEVRRDHTVSVGGNSINETKGTIEIASGRGTVISSGAIGMTSRAFSKIRQREEPEFANAKASLLAMESALPTGGITVRAQTMLNEQVGMSRMTVIGATATEFVGLEKSAQVGKLMQLKSGGTFVISTADNLAVTAGDRIDLVCGKSSIRMTADGKIEIKGTSIKMDAGQIDLN